MCDERRYVCVMRGGLHGGLCVMRGGLCTCPSVGSRDTSPSPSFPNAALPHAHTALASESPSTWLCPHATCVVLEALHYLCTRPYATNVLGLTLLMYEA